MTRAFPRIFIDKQNTNKFHRQPIVEKVQSPRNYKRDTFQRDRARPKSFIRKDVVHFVHVHARNLIKRRCRSLIFSFDIKLNFFADG